MYREEVDNLRDEVARDLNKAISLFYLFFPGLKQEYKQFFSSLSTVRNVSVHASVPDFQRYELDRIAYFSTKLYSAISDLKVFKRYAIKIEQKTKRFLKSYADEEIKKVKVALDKARSVVKNGELSEPSDIDVDWESMSTQCPICSSPAFYYGETEGSSDIEGIELTFQCEGFSCGACGLELENYEELELAGMETSLDREDDVEQWAEEHGYYDHDDRW